MYAVIETGGKQYVVKEGMKLRIERLAVDAGSTVTFDQVLFIGGNGTPKIGSPVVDGAVVTAEIVAQDRDRKVVVYHKKRRKGYEKKYGHRQPYTDVLVKKISA